jgi:hypothetical protein
MARALRVIRNGMIASAIVLAAVAYGTRVRAQQWDNCEDVSASWQWADLTYCGPYYYETQAAQGLTDTAYTYVNTYGWGGNVQLYWMGRDTPFDEDAYYSAGFQVY